MSSVIFNSSYLPINQVSFSQEIEGLPSLMEAKKTFWRLGDRFWMQIIDGKYHQYGPMVFDDALHKGPKEAGFFNSLKNGCEFASEYLTEKPTVNFYKELHKKLCAHFKGSETKTKMHGHEAGIFRDDIVHCQVPANSEEAEKNAYIVEVFERKTFLESFKERNFVEYQRIVDSYPESKKWLGNWEKEWLKKIDDLNAYFSEIFQQLSESPFVSICKRDGRGIHSDYHIRINYDCTSPRSHERIVQKLFDRYNENINEINLKLRNTSIKEQKKKLLEEKVKTIASLYQILDRLHPFPDGQGRTDLVLMAKLLSEEGFNPAILNEPYTSSWSLLDDWKNYLLEGVERWKQI